MDFFTNIVEFLDQFGLIGLIIMSFAEASFFPIPPDVLLIPMGISNPDKAIIYAIATTISSVAGAVLGWWIGQKYGRRILLRIVSENVIHKAERYFHKYGGQTLLIAGFTPIPFKVFTILSGVSQLKVKDVILWSLIGRSARFLLEGTIIMYFGDRAVQILHDYFPWITSIGGIIIVLIIMVMAKINKNAIG